MWNESLLYAAEAAIRTSRLHDLVIQESEWLWPLLESLHFMGMSVLIGTIGMFDLRLLGFATSIPVRALHRLIPVGIGAFLLNVTTGALFISAYPDQYIFNDAFRVKVVLLGCAGLNVLIFYARQFRRLERLGPGEPLPLGARVAGGISLLAWIGVMTAGRLITFFRPLWLS